MICLGEGWLAAATDQRIVRIFSITGIQLRLFSIAGPVVSMAASDNKLMVVYHSGLGLYGRCYNFLFSCTPGSLLTSFSIWWIWTNVVLCISHNCCYCHLVSLSYALRCMWKHIALIAHICSFTEAWLTATALVIRLENLSRMSILLASSLQTNESRPQFLVHDKFISQSEMSVWVGVLGDQNIAVRLMSVRGKKLPTYVDQLPLSAKSTVASLG